MDDGEDTEYWTELVKSVSAVTYQGQESALNHSSHETHILFSRCRYGTAIPVYATLYLLTADLPQSATTMQGAFLAMSLYPEAQRKAQEELDRIVGRGRLPNFGDLDSLVYINAVVKESLRWHNVVPLGIPHKTIHDDFFCGYFVPAGSVVISNIWSVLFSVITCTTS